MKQELRRRNIACFCVNGSGVGEEERLNMQERGGQLME